MKSRVESQEMLRVEGYESLNQTVLLACGKLVGYNTYPSCPLGCLLLVKDAVSEELAQCCILRRDDLQ